jgi:hypothetical protein
MCCALPLFYKKDLTTASNDDTLRLWGPKPTEVNEMTLYCDMDGVLVDFSAGALELINTALKNPEKHKDCINYKLLKKRLAELDRDYVITPDLEKAEYRDLPEDAVLPEARRFMKELIHGAGAEWWETLPWMPNGKELWKGLKEYTPTILSAPMCDVEGCCEGKFAWVENNLGLNVPVVLEDEKFHYATTDGEPNVLVDDFTFNTKPWKEKEGIPVLHVDKTYKETLEEVAELLS